MTKPRLEHELSQLAIASPQVVGIRLWRMGLAGALPNAADRREFRRMQQEKFDAMQDGWMAMGTATMQAQTRMVQGMWRSWLAPWTIPQQMMDFPAQAQDAVSGIVAQGLAPARRRAVANAKRLRASKRR